MKPWIIFGDSHAGVLARAGAERGDGLFAGGPLMGGSNFYLGRLAAEGGRWVAAAGFEDKVGQFLAAAGVPDFESCAGRLLISLGFTTGPLFNDRRFANDNAWRSFFRGPVAPPNKAYLSTGAMHRIMRDAQAPILDLYRVALAQGWLAAAIAAPPPPSDMAERYGRALTYELHAAFEAPLRALLAAEGLPIVEVPEETIEPGGGLRPEFVGVDGFHGNQAYAHLMLDRTLALLGRPPETA
ncbi:MAG: hypothetical protein IT548_09350 [Alphaproteobacteria bacterium]|nr:hypothetical protein [Alphaproteobacteria bacterium]